MRKIAIAILLCILLLPLLAKAQTSSPEPAQLDHFVFDEISDGQTVGVPFTVTITAMDQYNHVFISYNGTNTLRSTEVNFEIVDISKWYHVSGSTGAFTNGVWSGQVTIPRAFYYWQISTSGEGKDGSSNLFKVNNPPTKLSPTPSPTLPNFGPTSSPTPTPTPAPTLPPEIRNPPHLELIDYLLTVSIIVAIIIVTSALLYGRHRKTTNLNQ